MPNRILHERVCTSDTLAQLTAEEERTWHRLMVQCDDFGRFDGRATVVRARCYATMLDRITDEQVRGHLAALEREGLIAFYTAEGRPFLRVVTWDKYQQKRAQRSKYPDPDGPDSTCNHLLADAGNCPRETRNEKREARSEKRESRLTADAATPALRVVKRAADQQFVERLVAEYAPLFGSDESARARVDAALGHKARRNTVDEQAYLRNWLRKDLDRLQAQAPARARVNGATPAGSGEFDYLDEVDV